MQAIMVKRKIPFALSISQRLLLAILCEAAIKIPIRKIY